ncbi:uncharacterized protein IUM83_03904 [Phytophthora cinnamomi]|uniref:uncharacterized protein n=1 Tax=Phytophthora cinnamomi TaxID=4785 RepID=UPI00355A421D|nr:hypothetical protein IUM83_03904 [Phytophthora cinnamomi]
MVVNGPPPVGKSHHLFLLNITGASLVLRTPSFVCECTSGSCIAGLSACLSRKLHSAILYSKPRAKLRGETPKERYNGPPHQNVRQLTPVKINGPRALRKVFVVMPELRMR